MMFIDQPAVGRMEFQLSQKWDASERIERHETLQSSHVVLLIFLSRTFDSLQNAPSYNYGVLHKTRVCPLLHTYNFARFAFAVDYLTMISRNVLLISFFP